MSRYSYSYPCVNPFLCSCAPVQSVREDLRVAAQVQVGGAAVPVRGASDRPEQQAAARVHLVPPLVPSARLARGRRGRRRPARRRPQRRPRQGQLAAPLEARPVQNRQLRYHTLYNRNITHTGSLLRYCCTLVHRNLLETNRQVTLAVVRILYMFLFVCVFYL